MSDDLTAGAIQARVCTQWLGSNCIYRDRVDSTNARLLEWARGDAPHGTLLAADTQSHGRGRLSRTWHSPAGLNLYFSVLLRPRWDLGATPTLSLAAGVALAESCRKMLPSAPELKWPNDLLWSGRKLAGILVETAVDSSGVLYAVVGIGINVNQRQFPAELQESAGSLRLAAGRCFDRLEVLAAVLEQLETWIDCLGEEGGSRVVAAWKQHAPWLGRQITVRHGDQVLSGTAVGLEPHGALRLRDADGREHSMLSGDASLTDAPLDESKRIVT